jgi:DNA excision repair protein ERCC-4
VKIIQDMKAYAKPTGNYASKQKSTVPSESGDTSGPPTVQQKLVLLTLSFPRVRIIWSSSPYATADIFNDLKVNQFEPDYKVAVGIGAEEDPDAGAGVNTAAEELLRTIPGITAKNAKYVMSRVPSIRALCELSLKEVQDIIGSEPGKLCWEFLHWGEHV